MHAYIHTYIQVYIIHITDLTLLLIFICSISSCIGSGHFGTVHKGIWKFKNGKLVVAIKTLKPDLGEEEKVKFLQEAAIMGQFLHPNIVQLHGVVTIGEPVSHMQDHVLYNCYVFTYILVNDLFGTNAKRRFETLSKRAK